MYSIKTLNKISNIIYTELENDSYTVSDSAENYEGILVRSADMHEMKLPENLLAIARAGAGVNNIPVDACTEKGIVVFNTPGANANAVKELVICGMLLSGRQVIEGCDWLADLHLRCADNIETLVEKGKSRFVGPELAGKKLGVIGLGAIGVMVANAADKGLGMEVMGYDPYLSVDAAWNLTRSIIHVKTIEEIFSKCDYISLHLPLNDKTRGMIDEKTIASMKQGAVILNFARGGLVDDEAIISALESGHIRHYVTDFPNDKLLGRKGIIATPHLGASTPESEENCAQMAARQLKSYIEDGNIVNSVNLPRCEMPRTEPFRLAIINRNVKNMLGQMSAVLADAGFNIEHMMNSSRGDWAYTLFDLSVEPDEAVIKKLENIDGIIKVRLIK
ncbi:MAG: phosphoglycerate dehydrogenase [Oscillospiraceae bacterium]|nr:phosphoglycerate dehydrogenase [Oscillospiraceae bacterium]